MKNIIYILLTLIFLFSCETQTKIENIEVSTAIVTIHSSKKGIEPMLIFIEFENQRIILFDTKIKSIPIPPPPNSIEYIGIEQNNKMEPELIIPSNEELESLRLKLHNFEENDFKDKVAPAYDGFGFSLNVIYVDNKIKNVDLVNETIDSHNIFFKELFKIIFGLSENSEHIKTTYGLNSFEY